MFILEKIKTNEAYKNALINSLIVGINDSHKEIFVQTLLYVIDEKLDLFSQNKIVGSFYENDVDIQDLILPTIKRLYGKVFITPPTIFSSATSIQPNENGDKRFRLFVMYFDLDNFIDYLIEMILKTKGILSEFEGLDRTSEHLSLIVDNYIANNVKKVTSCKDIDSEIKRIERQQKIKDVLND